MHAEIRMRLFGVTKLTSRRQGVHTLLVKSRTCNNAYLIPPAGKRADKMIRLGKPMSMVDI